MFTQRLIGIQKEDTLIFQILLNAVINHFALILSADPGQEFLLSFGDAQPVEGILDIFRHVIPTAG
jgi:hypothetical protein